jgi:ribosomal protein L29
MKINDIRNLKKEELEKELGSLEAELVTAKKEIRYGKEKNVKKNLRIKRNIARIRTVLNELERENGKGKSEKK